MRFVHYSDQPLTNVCHKRQLEKGDHRGTKPLGLWLSVVGEDGSDS
jgi:hypothetical protein